MENWDPTLIADITLILLSARLTDHGPALEWSTSGDRPDVRLERKALLLNGDRFRGDTERLALAGIAAKHNLEMGEWK